MHFLLDDTARAALRSHTAPGHDFKDTSEPAGDGLRRVWLSEDVIERLEKIRAPGESDSDLIVRVCATFGNPPSARN